MNQTIATNASQVATSADIASWELPFEVTLTVLMTYITMCQLLVFIYDVKKKKISFDRRQAVTKNIAFAMNLTTVLAGAVGVSHYFMRNLYFIVEINVGLFASLVVSAMFAYSAIYFVLWLKQIHLYLNPAMNHLATPIMRYSSYLQGVVIGVFGPGYYIFIFCLLVYEQCDHGACTPSWSSVVFIGNQFQNQIALLILFAAPLIKHKASNNASSRKDGSIMAVVKRSVVVTAVSIAADLVAIGVFALSQKGGAYSVGILLNYLSILLCYTDWRTRFFPFLINRKVKAVRPVDKPANPEKGEEAVEESTRKTAWN